MKGIRTECEVIFAHILSAYTRESNYGNYQRYVQLEKGYSKIILLLAYHFVVNYFLFNFFGFKSYANLGFSSLLVEAVRNCFHVYDTIYLVAFLSMMLLLSRREDNSPYILVGSCGFNW